MCRLPALVVLALVACACGETRTGAVGLSGGIESGTIETTTVTVDCEGQVARLRSEWETEIAAAAREDRDGVFQGFSRTEFERRLETGVQRFGFRVVELQWLTPLQAAPALVLQLDDPDALDHLERLHDDILAMYAILDPRVADGRSTFEAFYFEARDADGVPFVAYANHSRGDEPAGAVWTRFDDFYIRGVPTAIRGKQVVLCS